jgi:hypothetical protein
LRHKKITITDLDPDSQEAINLLAEQAMAAARWKSSGQL